MASIVQNIGAAFQDGVEQITFRSKMIIGQSDINSGQLRDLAQGHGIIAKLREQGLSRIQYTGFARELLLGCFGRVRQLISPVRQKINLIMLPSFMRVKLYESYCA